MGLIKVAALVVMTLGAGGQADAPVDRLYGRVVTAGGDVFEGFLRWDRNEGSWADLLDGSKEMPWQNARDAERLEGRDDRRGRERSIRVLGLRISWNDDEDRYPSSASSGIRFGHLRSLAVLDDDRALLTLKSGEEIELEGGSTDLGDELRGLVVEDAQRGEVELRWRDLDVVDFMAAPRGVEAPRARRLYGTLRVRSGAEFTGYVSWDVDEILTSDILDGEDRGRDRKIPFDRIAAIERAGSSGARVILANGEELELRGSNDVDSGNRGIAVSDPGLGQVEVGWDDFEEVTFQAAPPGEGAYDAFDGGHPLFGAVRTRDGEEYSGYIRWDNDEAYSWEILDGRDGDVDFDVEFGQVDSIRRAGSRGADVTLRDGRTLHLEGSNDVDEDNKGIFLTLDDGETVLVPWRDFAEAWFEAP
ncbi:MAG TPA: hypothetical protein VJ997_01225 [Longimicrobiales bacterium]|nr:hypothetical protein [Longimicrobiales bacterium]